MARRAHSLQSLLDQVNKAKGRSTASDGWIGDKAHSSRKSDHNPDKSGVVRAIDITHDPKHGVDGNKLAAAVIASKDRRLKYIIWNRSIISGSKGPSPWQWRAYDGANPHDKHIHFSVLAGEAGDKAGPWAIGSLARDDHANEVEDNPLLRRGSKGEDVQRLQRALAKWGSRIEVDGDFGEKTEAAVKAFQKDHGLVPDGIVGQYTWRALLSA